MAKYNISNADGLSVTVDAPEGASQAELAALANQQYSRQRAMQQLGIEEPQPPGILGAFANAVNRGTRRTVSSFTDVIPAIAASAVGADEYARRQLEEYADVERRIAEEVPAQVASYKDIGGVGDALKYGAETIGELVPQVATMLIPGGAAGAFARGAATKVATAAGRKLAEEAVQREIAKKVTRSQLGGAYLGSLALNTPEVFTTIEQRTGAMEPGVAVLTGAVSAALDSIVPASVLAKLSPGLRASVVGEILGRKGAAPEVVQTAKSFMLRGAAKGAAGEAATEAAQQALNISAADFVDKTENVWGSQQFQELVDSAIRGAVGGGVLGAVGGVGERSQAVGQERARQQEERRIADAAAAQAAEQDQSRSIEVQQAMNDLFPEEAAAYAGPQQPPVPEDLREPLPEAPPAQMTIDDQIRRSQEEELFQQREAERQAQQARVLPRQVAVAQAQKAEQDVANAVETAEAKNRGIAPEPAPTAMALALQAAQQKQEESRKQAVAEGTAEQQELPLVQKRKEPLPPEERAVVDEIAALQPKETLESVDLEALGIPRRVPVHRRVVGKDLSVPEVRAQVAQELQTFAKRKDTPPETAGRVNRYVASLAPKVEPAAPVQGALVGPKGGIPKPGKAFAAPAAAAAPSLEQPVRAPVAESQARATSEPRDGGVAPTQVTDGPDIVAAKAAPSETSRVEATPKKAVETETVPEQKAKPAEEKVAEPEYFRGPRRETALRDIAADLVFGDPANKLPGEKAVSKPEREAHARAKEAEAWVRENQPERVTELEQAVAKVAKSLERGKHTDAQLNLESKAREDEQKRPVKEMAPRVEEEEPVAKTAVVEDKPDVTEKEARAMVTEALSYNAPFRGITEAKVKEHQDVAEETAAFLQKGGKITEVPASMQKLLRKDALLASEMPLSDAALDLARKDNLAGAMATLVNGPNKTIGKIATGLTKALGNTRVRVISGLRDDYGHTVPGYYEPKTDTVFIDAETGTTTHVLLHEVTHAVTSHILDNKAHPATKQLQKLLDDVAPLSPTAYGVSSIHEFIAEANSNMKFREFLNSVTPKGDKITAWERFVNIIGNLIRNLAGMSTRQLGTALQEIDTVVDSILAPAPGMRDVGKLYAASVAGKIPDVIGRFAESVTDRPASQTQIKAAYAWLNGGTKGVTDIARETIMGLVPLKVLSDAYSEQVPATRDLFDLIEQMSGENVKYEGQINSTIKAVKNYLGNDASRRTLLDNVVALSTVEEVDPSRPIAEYKDTPEKVKIWQDLQKDWTALGDGGRKAYTALRDSYAALYESLLEVIGARLDEAVPGGTADAKKERSSVKDTIMQSIVKRGRIWPYFPLFREGNYWITFPDGADVGHAAFESEAQRARAIELMRANGIEPKIETDFASLIASKDIPRTSTLHAMIKAVSNLQAPKMNADGTVELDKNGKAVMGPIQGKAKELLLKEFLNAMPESSVLRSFQKREGFAGFQQNAVHVFQQRAPAFANQIVRLRNDSKIESLRTQTSKEITEAVGKGADAAAMASLTRTMKTFIETAKNPAIAPWARRLKGLGFIWTLGANVSSVVVNMANIPIVVFPYLAGRYGAPEALRMIGSAYGTFSGTGRGRTVETLEPVGYDKDGNLLRDSTGRIRYKTAETKGWWSLENIDFDDPQLNKETKDLKELLDEASSRGQLSRSLMGEQLELNNPDTTLIDKINGYSGLMFHHGERMNRQVTMVAAYRLELERLKAAGEKIDADARKKAATLAVDVTEDTNGNALQGTGPKYSQGNWGSILFMYKKFGISMLNLQIQTVKRAFLDSKLSPEEKTIAKRQIAGMFAMSALLAGAQGMPFYGIVATVWNAVMGDDEEEDFDMMASRVLGQTLYDGILNEAFGLDVSGRIGMSNLIFRTQPNREQENLLLYGAELLGGPVFGVASRVLDGAKYIHDGEIQRGFERFLPAAISNGLKSARYAVEGAHTLRGDPIVEDISPWNIAAQSLGFAPAEYSRQLEVNAINKRIERVLTEKRTGLARKYYLAIRNNDSEAADEVVAEMAEFNKRVPPEVAITGEYLKRSLKQHMRTSAEAARFGGVTISRMFQRTAQERTEAYEEGWE